MSYNSTSCALPVNELLESNSQESKSNKSNVDSSYEYGEVTIHERLKMCFRPKYRMRKVTNRGAVLCLELVSNNSALLRNLQNTISRKVLSNVFSITKRSFGISLSYSVLGDLYFQRYKVLFWSIVFMWISVVLLTATILVESLFLFGNYVQLTFLVFLGISCGGFQANIIQFLFVNVPMHFYSQTYITVHICCNIDSYQ